MNFSVSRFLIWLLRNLCRWVIWVCWCLILWLWVVCWRCGFIIIMRVRKWFCLICLIVILNGWCWLLLRLRVWVSGVVLVSVMCLLSLCVCFLLNMRCCIVVMLCCLMMWSIWRMCSVKLCLIVSVILLWCLCGSLCVCILIVFWRKIRFLWWWWCLGWLIGFLYGWSWVGVLVIVILLNR